MLSDKDAASISWSLTKLKCVVRSTLAAATSVPTDGWDMCSETLSKSLTKELSLSNFKKESHLEAFTAKTFETLNITKSMLDRHLCVKISALREMLAKCEISIYWI